MEKYADEVLKRCAQKMLEGKLDFLPIGDAYELYKQGIILETREHYVISVEEFEEWDFEGKETEFYIKEILKDYPSLEEAVNRVIEIGDDYDHFDEFTYGLFPAPTYIDLIK